MTKEDYQKMYEELQKIEKDLSALASSMDILSLSIKATVSKSWITNPE